MTDWMIALAVLTAGTVVFVLGSIEYFRLWRQVRRRRAVDEALQLEVDLVAAVADLEPRPSNYKIRQRKRIEDTAEVVIVR